MKKFLLITAATIIGLGVVQAQTPFLEYTFNNNSYTNTGSLAGNGFNDGSYGISVNGSGYTGHATDYAFYYDAGSGVAFGTDGNTSVTYPQLNGLTAVTVMLWVKLPANTLSQVTNHYFAGGPWTGRLVSLEGICGFGFDDADGAYPNGAIKFEGDDGFTNNWIALSALPFNPATNTNWQFMCWRWDTNGVYKMDVGNKTGTLASMFNQGGARNTAMSNPVWNQRFGAGGYQNGISGTYFDNCRFFGTNLSDAQVLAIYNADVAAANVPFITNTAPSTVATGVAISYPTGDLTTNYVVQAAGTLNSPVGWGTVNSKAGNNTTNTYYEVVGNTNKFFQVLQVH